MDSYRPTMYTWMQVDYIIVICEINNELKIVSGICVIVGHGLSPANNLVQLSSPKARSCLAMMRFRCFSGMVVAFWIEASGSPFRYSQMARATFSGVIPSPVIAIVYTLSMSIAIGFQVFS